MVERSLSMREVRGSIPRTSTFCFRLAAHEVEGTGGQRVCPSAYAVCVEMGESESKTRWPSG